MRKRFTWFIVFSELKVRTLLFCHALFRGFSNSTSEIKACQ